ncbi:MAG: TadE family protein, partial [Planctomycetota bacterium]
MVEFALISLALYLVLAAIIGIGRWLAVAQAAQDIARFAAREIALYPLPPEVTFAEALADPGFQGAVYSSDFLVIDLRLRPPGEALDSFFASMPTVNRALRPLMITSDVDAGGERRRVLHVPGALVDSSTSESRLTVAVPRIL